jgi:hypothetical protein
MAAEQFYRQELKHDHLSETLEFLRTRLKSQTRERIASLGWIFGDLNPVHFLNEIERSLLSDKLNLIQLRSLINLVLQIVNWGNR